MRGVSVTLLRIKVAYFALGCAIAGPVTVGILALCRALR